MNKQLDISSDDTKKLREILWQWWGDVQAVIQEFATNDWDERVNKAEEERKELERILHIDLGEITNAEDPGQCGCGADLCHCGTGGRSGGNCGQ